MESVPGVAMGTMGMRPAARITSGRPSAGSSFHSGRARDQAMAVGGCAWTTAFAAGTAR
jgi:hypothetical protein